MSFESIHYFNIFVGVGAILLQVLAVVSLFMLFFGPRKNKFLDFIDRHVLELGLFISVSGMVFSLVYSEIINYAACYLCWWARVFLYPQVVLFAIALWNKDRKVIKYSAPLSFLGVLVSLYHNFGYYFTEKSGPCDASGVSCYQQFVHEFGGYISIPTLSLTAILCMLVIVTVAHFYGKRD